MKPSTTLSTLFALVLAAIAAIPTPSARAQTGDNLPSLSHQLAELTGELRDEFSLHYRQADAFGPLMRSAGLIETEFVSAETPDHFDSAKGNDRQVRDLFRRVSGVIEAMEIEVHQIRHGHQDPGQPHGIGHGFRPGISLESDSHPLALGRD